MNKYYPGFIDHNRQQERRQEEERRQERPSLQIWPEPKRPVTNDKKAPTRGVFQVDL